MSIDFEEWAPLPDGQRFVTTNPGYAQPMPNGPRYARQPRYGAIVKDRTGRTWRVAIGTNGGNNQFFEIQYCVRFDDKSRSEWVREHVVSGRGSFGNDGPIETAKAGRA